MPNKRGARTALDLFEQASRPGSSVPCNLITINTILRHHARAADVEAMTLLFNLAEKLKFKPDVVTWTTLVQGLLRADQLGMAKRTLDTMYSLGQQPNERMCSMLVNDLAKNGERTGLQYAEELLREMKKKGFRPGVVTWTGLISGYFLGGWEQDGWDAVDRMEREQGLLLNRVAYHVIIRQAGQGKLTPGTTPVTPKLFKRMMEDGITPNAETYQIMLEPLLKARLFPEATQVVRNMKRLRFVPEKSQLINLVKRARLKRAY